MIHQYCRFCGSSDLRDIQVKIKKIREDELKPELSYLKFKVSAGAMRRIREDSSRYITKFCRICRNIDAVDPTSPTTPLEAYFSDSKKWVVIPFMLKTHLKLVQYDEVDIRNLIRKIRICLEKIYNKWSIDGVNPCKGNHMGKKITIPLKHGVGIFCWVIIDLLADKVYLRISYGGGKITCPEN